MSFSGGLPAGASVATVIVGWLNEYGVPRSVGVCRSTTCNCGTSWTPGR
jgi:hypothetical protein